MRSRIREISPAISPTTSDPGTAAHSAKNEIAAPGLPNQPLRDYSGRNPMVTQAVADRAAEYISERALERGER